jgi:hypothetical protein
MGDRKPYKPPTIRRCETIEIVGLLERALAKAARMETAARLWKALAKKLWHTTNPIGSMGRYGCAAIDVRLRRNGNVPPHERKRGSDD